MEFKGLELLIVSLVPFFFYLYAIFWLREMRSVFREINAKLTQQIEQSKRQHKELMAAEAESSNASAPQTQRVEKLAPIKR
jgi:hypothetical protein